ncbi:MAG: single-stranded DNA-binding protein [Deferribacterota bacterium]|nr:single-stranded DNA-binding protein [Deferribacterota bacterium]
MGFLNKVILLGNITRNPETRYLPGSNTPITKFGLAVNRRYKQNNELKEETCFIDIVAFGKTAEFASEFLTKGISLLVEGRLSYRTWEQDGVKRGKHEVIAENLQLVWRKDNSPTNNDNITSDMGINEEDIPF